MVVRWIASHPQGKTIARRVLFLDLSEETPKAKDPSEKANSALSYISAHMDTFLSGVSNGIDDEAAMREQAAALIKECMSNRKALIIKGSGAKDCPPFFRMVLNELLKESRPSARLSDAENNPVVYFDDADDCEIFEKLTHAFVSPSETGVEFVVSASSLSRLSKDVYGMLSRFGGLAVFSIAEKDARAMESFLVEAQLKKRRAVILENKELGLEHSAKDATVKLQPEVAVKLFSTQPTRSFFYLSKTSSSKPVRLLAPFFPEIRITEVEWTIVDSMRSGWKFNL